jgi:hypothetical protein
VIRLDKQIQKAQFVDTSKIQWNTRRSSHGHANEHPRAAPRAASCITRPEKKARADCI